MKIEKADRGRYVSQPVGEGLEESQKGRRGGLTNWRVWAVIGGGLGVIICTILFLCLARNGGDGEGSFVGVSDNMVTVPEELPAKGENAETSEDTAVTEIKNCNGNFTTNWGPLMLINPNFTVSTDWIATRRGQLIDITAAYGIYEGLAGNGTPLLDAEAAAHLAEMVADYEATNPGHTLTTRSCFRSVGTSCGRLCYATGTSDHHTGYTCDLVDDYYGGTLDTDLLGAHPEWQWLHNNSYKYGFIDRFVENWAGGSMSEPVNVNSEGTTGLYETWHYRYVGATAAAEIASGKYNNGAYDSLEHYLKASGRLTNLLSPSGNCL